MPLHYKKIDRKNWDTLARGDRIKYFYWKDGEYKEVRGIILRNPFEYVKNNIKSGPHFKMGITLSNIDKTWLAKYSVLHEVYKNVGQEYIDLNKKIKNETNKKNNEIKILQIDSEKKNNDIELLKKDLEKKNNEIKKLKSEIVKMKK